MNRKSRLISVFFFIVCSLAHAADWMPDAHLEQAIREELEIPDGIPMLLEDMTELSHLVVEHDIESLKGLEHAINLEFLHIGRSEVSDLTPLAELENLRVLKLYNNRITDITPLSGLINLKVLQLQVNQIADISSLAGLVGLQELNLEDNLLTDISPLQALVHLKTLNLGGNQILDFTPIYGLVGIETLRLGLEGSEIPIDSEVLEILNPVDRPVACDIASEPVLPRIENREYPSVFSSHLDIENRPDLSPLEVLTLSDFSFGYAPFRPVAPHLMFLRSIENKIQRGGVDLDKVVSAHHQATTVNPNMLFLVEIPYFDGRVFNLHEDSPYWLRNPDGTRAKRQWYVDHLGNEYWEPLLDFTKPEVQELIVDHAVAVAECGLYDGIWLDRWHRDLEDYFTLEIEFSARDKILKGIRAAVRDDFLIIVNATWQKIPRWTSVVNGIFVETWPRDNTEVYKREDYRVYEESLIWYEGNLREPQITLLSGEVKSYIDPMSPLAQRQMRVFTTLSLTHSDGYVAIRRTEPDADQVWYDFWDAPLGRPIGEKAQLYRGRDGVFIREFTNGWAIYNRSGTAQEIELPQEVSGWSSGVEHQRRHTLADLDGEIYLKAETSPTADVNGDGTVNILDLVIVANAFGETAPDVNGDGVVNILDLVVVANAFQ